MRKHASIVKVGVLFFLAVILAVPAASPVAAAQPVSKSFFSNGQAVSDAQNQAKSQQQAIQNLMAQGLIQAIATFLTPAQMGAQFDKLQKSVLAGPEKYVDSYQVYSENQAGGEFQVIGVVTVSMNTLKAELVTLGLLGAQNTPAAASSPGAPAAPVSAASAAAGPPAAASPTQAGAGANNQSAQPIQSQAPAPATVSTTPASAGQNGAEQLSRGIRPTKKEILWAVVEKWDEKWVLPTDSSNISCIFAHSIAKEMDGFGFSILLPQAGSVEMDNDGNIPPYQAVSLADALGVKDVVVGKVSYKVNRQSQEVSLNADLRVLNGGGNQSGVEIRKTLSMDDLSNQAGALELAHMMAPQLSGLFGGPKTLAENGGPGSAEFPAHLGKLVIYLPSLQYSNWTELQNVLHQQFQTMHVDDLQIGPVQTTVNLNGIDAGYILKMNGTRLPSGARVRIDSYSTQAGTMKISFISPAKVQAKSK